MHVVCKACGKSIRVANRPEGFTNLGGVVDVRGNVAVSGGRIGFGPGGSIGFGPGGVIGMGPPAKSRFVCMACGHETDYAASEILDG